MVWADTVKTAIGYYIVAHTTSNTVWLPGEQRAPGHFFGRLLDDNEAKGENCCLMLCAANVVDSSEARRTERPLPETSGLFSHNDTAAYTMGKAILSAESVFSCVAHS
ncbi:unnamed protein product [Ectocarpus sp. 12 AP-2014]